MVGPKSAHLLLPVDGPFDVAGLREESFPYEFMVRICNDLHADLWVAMPITADDEYLPISPT